MPYLLKTDMKMEYKKQQRLVVLGGGESGVGAAILGKEKGMDVFLSDCGKLADKYARQLQENDITFEQGHHTPELILNADVVVKSPGIPSTAPLVQQLIGKNVPVLSEIEFAGRYTNARMLCITGSNGKTTTTLLLHHILTSAGVDAALAGNVGKSMALQVAHEEHEAYVIELSSFQLENMYDFKADIALMLNITPDHMDRYDHKMENYTEAKFRICRNQTKTDHFIYWADDPVIRKRLMHKPVAGTPVPFAERHESGCRAWVENGLLFIDTQVVCWNMPRKSLSLPGLHNLYNSMAAALAATLYGIKPEVIKKALSDFRAVEHRLEFVAEIDGVQYINDSKATNVDSTYYALESMTRPTVLILGGLDKGNDYTHIDAFVREKVKGIVCMGVDNSKLLGHYTDMVPRITDTHSLKDAMRACREMAEPGDTVLLSPCCASFDLFKSYEDRGRQFKEEVTGR